MRIKPILRFYCHRMAAVAALVWAATCQTVLAQAYPTKPVQLINTSAEGGAGDFVARVIAEKLAPVLGQPVTVENRPGASGVTAARDVARAAPDGHTVLVGHTAELAILPHFTGNLGYDPQKDLQPVSLIAVRAGSGFLNRLDRWSLCLTAARMAAEQEKR